MNIELRHTPPFDTPSVRITARVTGLELDHLAGYATASGSERVAMVIKDVHRWQWQWWALLRARNALDDACNKAPTGNVLSEQTLEVGCSASTWLWVHLEANGYPVQDIEKNDARAGSLRDALDFANTHKHAGRSADKNGREKRVGRVLSYRQGEDGSSLTMVFATKGDPEPEERDGLELLNQCTAVWRQFLLDNGIDPPPPPDEHWLAPAT